MINACRAGVEYSPAYFDAAGLGSGFGVVVADVHGETTDVGEVDGAVGVGDGGGDGYALDCDAGKPHGKSKRDRCA